jgi:uncharacterized protein YlxW (UPF0749 family)
VRYAHIFSFVFQEEALLESEAIKSENVLLKDETQDLKKKLSTLEQELKNSKDACDMVESKTAAYEDLMLIKGITHREMMRAWNEDGVIVSVDNLMTPVRGAKKRRS